MTALGGVTLEKRISRQITLNYSSGIRKRLILWDESARLDLVAALLS
jgi:hypothetical protein